MEFSFFMPMLIPTTTAQMHKVTVQNGKPLFYDPPELKTAKVKIRDHLAAHIPGKPLRGPVMLLTEWLFPVTDDHVNGEFKTSKPDTDNLQKALKDIMTRLEFWNDDAQVAWEIIQKRYSDVPGIYIMIRELDE